MKGYTCEEIWICTESFRTIVMFYIQRWELWKPKPWPVFKAGFPGSKIKGSRRTI